MVGIDLHAQYASMIRHRRERHRLNVIAVSEEELSSAEGGGLVTHQDRNNRGQSAEHGQSQALRPGYQATDILVQAGVKQLVLRRGEDVRYNANRFQVRWRHRPAE